PVMGAGHPVQDHVAIADLVHRGMERHVRTVPATAVRGEEPRPELRPGDGLHPESLFRITFPPVRLLLLHQAPRSSRRSVEEWFEVLTDGLAQRDGDGISDLLDDLGHRSDELVTVREALDARSIPCRDGSIGWLGSTHVR